MILLWRVFATVLVWLAVTAPSSVAQPDREPSGAEPDNLDAIHLRRGGVVRGYLQSLDAVALVRVPKPAGEDKERMQQKRIPRAAIRLILLDGKPFPAPVPELPPLEDAAFLDNGTLLTGRITVADEMLRAGGHVPVPVETVTLIHLHEPPVVKPDKDTDGPPLARLDDLEACLAEVKARHREIAAFLTRQAAAIEEAKVEVLGAARHAENVAEGILVKQTEFFLKRAKMTPKDFKALLRQEGMEAQYSESAYRQARRRFVIGGLGQCIGAYYGLTRELLGSALKNGMEVLFWAEAVHLPLARFSEEVRTGRVTIGGSGKERRAEQEGPADLAELTLHRPTSKLTRALDAKFNKIRISADTARGNAMVRAHEIGWEAVKAAEPREKAKWCRTVTAPHREWAQAVAMRMNLAGERYQPMGTGTVKWAVAEVLRYRDFARKYGKRIPSPQSEQGRSMNTAVMHQGIDTNMGLLTEHFGHRHNRLSNFRLFLKELAEWYEKHRTANIKRIEDRAQQIVETCGSAPMVTPKIPSLKTGEVDDLLDRVVKGLKPDVNAAVADLPACKVDLAQAEQIYRAIGSNCVQD